MWVGRGVCARSAGGGIVGGLFPPPKKESPAQPASRGVVVWGCVPLNPKPHPLKMNTAPFCSRDAPSGGVCRLTPNA